MLFTTYHNGQRADLLSLSELLACDLVGDAAVNPVPDDVAADLARYGISI